MEPYPRRRSGLFRPRVAQRTPRRIPDEQFSELFARLSSHRDRALVAFWVSTGARASELLGATAGDADAGQQLITVIRKGTRLMQPLPASPDAFVWLRLYQAQMHGLVPGGADQPLWWTLRRPFRQLTYHAALRMFTRAGAALGAGWTLHDLAAYGCLADGQGSGDAAGRYPVGPRPCPAEHDPAVPEPGPRRRDRERGRVPRAPGTASACRTARAGTVSGYRPEIAEDPFRGTP